MLRHNVIPIVMGARPEDYEKSSPLKSYIHVDEFATPRELAAYLHRLDADDDLYNEYFRWKGTGEFVNTYFFCRLCALLNDPEMPRKNYKDVNDWWRGPGTCIGGSWRQHRPHQQHLSSEPHLRRTSTVGNDTLWKRAAARYRHRRRFWMPRNCKVAMQNSIFSNPRNVSKN